METTENTQIEVTSGSFLDQDHQAKRHKVLICDIQQESLKEMPPKLPHGNPKKRPRKSPKRKNGSNTSKPSGTTPNFIHTKEVHTRSSLPPDHLPSHKISP
jgi:hypothetical protein